MIIVWIILGLVGLIAVLAVFMYFRAIRLSGKVMETLLAQIEPALDAVQQNAPEAQTLIDALAAQPAPRNVLYVNLKAIGKESLFPSEYRTVEKIAESDMVQWLMHGNELAAIPTEIELVKRIPIDGEERTGAHFLFRFKTEPPQWAADRGFMVGLTGPYWDGEDNPGDHAVPFSKLRPYDEMSEDEHFEYLEGIRIGVLSRGE